MYRKNWSISSFQWEGKFARDEHVSHQATQMRSSESNFLLIFIKRKYVMTITTYSHLLIPFRPSLQLPPPSCPRYWSQQSWFLPFCQLGLTDVPFARHTAFWLVLFPRFHHNRLFYIEKIVLSFVSESKSTQTWHKIVFFQTNWSFNFDLTNTFLASLQEGTFDHLL